jgi:large subunit ribosomal protein L18
MDALKKREARIRRKKRVRKKVLGTTQKPRLCVFRSAKHIYAQLIDDTTGKTLVHASSLSKELAGQIKGKGGNKQGAARVGADIAHRAKDKGIKQVVFDRNGFLYHGRVKALSEAARENGLDF